MRKATDYRPEILRQAAHLFAQKPFHEVLMDDVAEHVGVAKGTLYRYYPNKDELYAAICFDWMDELTRALADLARQPGNARTRLDAMLLRFVHHFREHQDFFSVLQRQETQVALVQREEFLRRRAAVREVLADVIRQGQANAELRSCNAAASADMLMGMLRSLLWFGDPKLAPEAVAHTILDVFLDGISKYTNGGTGR